MLCMFVWCRGVKENGFDPEMFLQPLSVPKPPERFYFSFGAVTPICLACCEDNDCMQ